MNNLKNITPSDIVEITNAMVSIKNDLGIDRLYCMPYRGVCYRFSTFSESFEEIDLTALVGDRMEGLENILLNAGKGLVYIDSSNNVTIKDSLFTTAL